MFKTCLLNFPQSLSSCDCTGKCRLLSGLMVTAAQNFRIIQWYTLESPSLTCLQASFDEGKKETEISLQVLAQEPGWNFTCKLHWLVCRHRCINRKRPTVSCFLAKGSNNSTLSQSRPFGACGARYFSEVSIIFDCIQ